MALILVSLPVAASNGRDVVEPAAMESSSLISGLVFFDRDGDGVQDGNEVGIEQVVIQA